MSNGTISDPTDNIAVTIDAGRTRLVSIAQFGVRQNHITLLFGESGIGKSLLAKCMYGILDPDVLRIRVNDLSYREYCRQDHVRALQRNSFFVFQEPSSHLHPLLSVEHQLREGSLSRTRHEEQILGELWGGSGRGVREILPVYPKPHRPSGGEKQRILLAMAFKKIDRYLEESPDPAPALFVFDEPTGSLDNRYRDIVLSMVMTRYEQRPFTVLLITHDYSMISVMEQFARRHPHAVRFRELVRREKGDLEVVDFLPQTYTKWLEEQKVRRNMAASAPSGKPLLEVDTPVEVFGHQLVISDDPAGDHPCPLRIFPGTLVYLKAPSGTGKTTLVKMMMGLIQGRRLHARVSDLLFREGTPRRFWKRHVWGKRMSLVFQHADEALNPVATVREVFQGLPSRKAVSDDMIRRTLRLLFDEPTETFLRRKISALSGGQKQRLNLLRSLYLDTDLLIVDEPLNGLDFNSSTKVIALLQDRRTRGKSVLIISHNEEIFDTQVSPGHVYYLHATPVKRRKSPQQ
jgi:peptide/nickel transport system ATP-binding protein